MKKPSLPIQLLAVLGCALLFGHSVPEPVVRALYSFSLVFKECLGFFLPAVIFSFVLSGILAFKKNAPLVLGVLLLLIVTSNVLVCLTSYSIGSTLLPFLTDGSVTDGLITTRQLSAYFDITLPMLIRPEYALLSAVVIGLVSGFFNLPTISKISHVLRSKVETVLNTVVIPLLPLYILGFILKFVREGMLGRLFGTYGGSFLLILLIQAIVVTTAYLIATRGNASRAFEAMKNASSSYLAAFGAMSSTAAIPVTTVAATENTGNEPLANVAIPIMANIHLMGDAVTIPIFCLVTLFLFTGAIPSLATFLYFIVFFCSAMLATSGIPGGGIIVIIPILQSVLGFTPEMVSIITALYLLQDSFGTACNVFGDGALTMIANNILARILKRA